MGMMREAAIRGDQQAIKMMVNFKKKYQESAVEADMGGEVAALRQQLEIMRKPSARRQMVRKEEKVITSLRSTFEAGGSGYQRFTHVVKNFIRPKVA
jgi:hypothetical protein